MLTRKTIQPCLWFDHQGQEAAEYYVSIFPNSRITRVTHYGEAGREMTGMAPGTVMTVEFELDSQPFTALNAGPVFRFSEAVSFQVMCDTQEDIDFYWERLGEGGDETARQCGWLKDRYGLSWQIVPSMIGELIAGAHGDAVMAAIMKMKKLDIAAILAAAAR